MAFRLTTIPIANDSGQKHLYQQAFSPGNVSNGLASPYSLLVAESSRKTAANAFRDRSIFPTTFKLKHMSIVIHCELNQHFQRSASGLDSDAVRSSLVARGWRGCIFETRCWVFDRDKFCHFKLWFQSSFKFHRPCICKNEAEPSSSEILSETLSSSVPVASIALHEAGTSVTTRVSMLQTSDKSGVVDATFDGTGPAGTMPEDVVPKILNEVGNLGADSGFSLCIAVVGATGELARKKIFPALFALYYNGCLPKNVSIFGYSRSELSSNDLRVIISENLTCRVGHQGDCSDLIGSFLERLFYQSGGYENCDGMAKLDAQMQQLEGSGIGNRIFYLSVPQDVLLEVASCVAASAQSKKGWTRVIIEKPFGYDAISSAKLTKGLLSHFSEQQIYRIDHLLGKELIENLTVLRFSNLVFVPLWSRTYIRNVQFIVTEDWGLQGRGRYFESHGIIHDIIQTHILQTIALFAMEPPVSLDGEDIRNEKVKVLRSMRKLTLNDIVLGQYKASISKDGKRKVPGYLDEPNVSANSLTPTFAAAILYIDNARWDGVPFLIKAGIGMIKHRVEIRIQFRHVPGNLYREKFGHNIDLSTNELVLQIQPNEAILLKINNKVPGLDLKLDSSELNLLYRDRYGVDIPDSYEHLILDIINGDNHLFIRSDELDATWDLVMPVLNEINEYKVAPELYQYGGRGPIGAYYLGAKHGVRWADD